MQSAPIQPDEALPIHRIDARSRGPLKQVHALLQARELVAFLIWRDIRVRYKQALLGAAWAVVQPLATMLIFLVVFSRLAGMPTDGVHPSLFFLSALVLWSYVNNATSLASSSLMANMHLITKVSFPRFAIPLAAALAPLLDLVIGSVVLLIVALFLGAAVSWTWLIAPLAMLLAIITVIGVASWMAPLMARYRDIKHILPFSIQLWLFASPIAYPASLVPEQWRALYACNPLVSAIELFRWSTVGGECPRWLGMRDHDRDTSLG